MAEPTMHIPRRWVNSDFGRRLYTEGWRDGVTAKENRYADIQAALDLVREQGQAALTAYEDGYKAGQDAAEKDATK